MKKEKVFPRLMGYAGKHKILTYLSLVFSAISGILAIMPFVYIYFIIRDVVQVAPDFSKATNLVFYGWMAVMFAILSILVYIGALMCSHIAAFRIAGNMRISYDDTCRRDRRGRKREAKKDHFGFQQCHRDLFGTSAS